MLHWKRVQGSITWNITLCIWDSSNLCRIYWFCLPNRTVNNTWTWTRSWGLQKARQDIPQWPHPTVTPHTDHFTRALWITSSGGTGCMLNIILLSTGKTKKSFWNTTQNFEIGMKLFLNHKMVVKKSLMEVYIGGIYAPISHHPEVVHYTGAMKERSSGLPA